VSPDADRDIKRIPQRRALASAPERRIQVLLDGHATGGRRR
jgi:hypothetical protein